MEVLGEPCFDLSVRLRGRRSVEDGCGAGDFDEVEGVDDADAAAVVQVRRWPGRIRGWGSSSWRGRRTMRGDGLAAFSAYFFSP